MLRKPLHSVVMSHSVVLFVLLHRFFSHWYTLLVTFLQRFKEHLLEKHNSDHLKEVSALDYKQVIPVSRSLPVWLWCILWCFIKYFSFYVFVMFGLCHISVILNIIYLLCLLDISLMENVLKHAVFFSSTVVVSNNYAILIGCTVGGFFATILVFGLLYILLQRSESFQKCFSKYCFTCCAWTCSSKCTLKSDQWHVMALCFQGEKKQKMIWAQW